jgi:hypothetical protein
MYQYERVELLHAARPMHTVDRTRSGKTLGQVNALMELRQQQIAKTALLRAGNAFVQADERG